MAAVTKFPPPIINVYPSTGNYGSPPWNSSTNETSCFLVEEGISDRAIKLTSA